VVGVVVSPVLTLVVLRGRPPRDDSPPTPVAATACARLRLVKIGFFKPSQRSQTPITPAKRKMILTKCAACAAPLAHTAPRCIRCQTRYCNATCHCGTRTAAARKRRARDSGRSTHLSRRRARLTSARTCAARGATGKPPGAGIRGSVDPVRPNGSGSSTSGGGPLSRDPRIRDDSSCPPRTPRETRGWLISRGAVCLPTGPTGTWKATTNKNHDY
jgi:hypothetical protein